MKYVIFFTILVGLVLLFRRSKFLNFKGIFNNNPKMRDFVKSEKVNLLNMDEEFNARKLNKQEEIDRILDKISRKGIKSLTNNEKEYLDKYSNE